MSSITVDLDAPTAELIAAGTFLQDLAFGRSPNEAQAAVPGEEPIPARKATRKGARNARTVEMPPASTLGAATPPSSAQISVRGVSGEVKALYSTPTEVADALVAIIYAAPQREQLDALLTANADTLKTIGPDSDRVIAAYGEQVDKFTAAATAAAAPKTDPKPNPAPAAQTVDPAVKALFEDAAVTSVPADPAQLKKEVMEMLQTYMGRPDVGFAGGTAYMKQFNADRFSKIDEKAYPQIWTDLKAKLA